MTKRIARIVAVLIIPCLVMDGSFAAAFADGKLTIGWSRLADRGAVWGAEALTLPVAAQVRSVPGGGAHGIVAGANPLSMARGGLFPAISAADTSWFLPQRLSQKQGQKRPPASEERVDMAAQVLRAVNEEAITHFQIAALLGNDPAVLLKKKGWMTKYGIAKGTAGGELDNVSDIKFETAVQLIAAVAGQEPNSKDVRLYLGLPLSEEAEQTTKERLEKLKQAQSGRIPGQESATAVPLPPLPREEKQEPGTHGPLSWHIPELSTLGARCTLALLAGDADFANLPYEFIPGTDEWTVKFSNPQDLKDTRWFRFVGPGRLQRTGYRMVFGDSHVSKMSKDRYRSELLDFLIVVPKLLAQIKGSSPWLHAGGGVSGTKGPRPATAKPVTGQPSHPKTRRKAPTEPLPATLAQVEPTPLTWESLIQQVKKEVGNPEDSIERDAESSGILNARLWILELFSKRNFPSAVAEALKRPRNNRLDGTILALALFADHQLSEALSTIAAVRSRFGDYRLAKDVQDWLAAAPAIDHDPSRGGGPGPAAGMSFFSDEARSVEHGLPMARLSYRREFLNKVRGLAAGPLVAAVFTCTLVFAALVGPAAAQGVYDVSALAGLKAPGAIPALLEAAVDSDSHVRLNAARGLEMLSGSPYVLDYALHLLETIPQKTPRQADLLDLLQRARMQKIVWPFRFSLPVLREVIQNLETLKPDGHDLAVVNYPGKDYNGAFYDTSVVEQLMTQGFRVLYAETSDDAGWIDQTLHFTENEQLSLLVLAGHGGKERIRFDMESRGERHALINLENAFDASDVKKILASGLTRRFKPGAPVLLLACKAGAGHLPEVIHRAIPDAGDVWSTRQSYAHQWLLFKSKNLWWVVFDGGKAKTRRTPGLRKRLTSLNRAA